MAEILGPLTLQNKALPTGVDGTRVAQWMMRDGVSYGEFINQVALALGQANQMLVDKWGFLFSITEEIMMEYPNGGSISEMDELTDVDKPVPIHGATIGHMLPLRYYGQGLGGSKRYFRDLRSPQLEAQITGVVNRGIWRFEKRLLTRFFTNTEEAIGSAGYSVPFVRGSGGNVDFAPPAFDGVTFATTHDHFQAYDKDASDPTVDLSNVLEGLAATLVEHGHDAPFTALVSRSNTAAYAALTNFVTLVDNVVSVIDRGGVTSGSQLFATGDRGLGRIGFYQSQYGLIELVASGRIPADYAGMTKSYGVNNSRNALAIRVHPMRGFGLAVVPETTLDDDFPIKQLDVDFEFGIGVGMDRTNGAAAFLVDNDTWANPTIT